MAYLAAIFIGYVLGCITMVVVFTLDQQREDRYWRQWQPTAKELKE